MPPKNTTEQTLPLKLAQDAMNKAYAPYSKFHVGAVILAENGQYYAGCNVENAAYPEGNCAETSAIAAMVINGQRTITAIWVMGSGDALVTPCGGCRQRIREFAAPQTPIYICDPQQGIRLKTTLAALLPHSFGPNNLT